MGAMLPKPVLSSIVERRALAGRFRIGVAEINGWRNKMEDAHVIHLRDDWAFFGVFDGHGGEACSLFVAAEFRRRLEEHGCPQTDADVKEMMFDIDKAFLDKGVASGSTGAMCIVHRDPDGSKLRLRVINAGDSRVFLGRADGTIIDGGGTEEGLTTDHKPDHPGERARIYRCGGHVVTQQHGVPRVNGDLAVSRGFGDAEYKKTGGPSPEDRPVTVDPELGRFECDQADFLVIACDGVSEGDYPNQEVVKHIAEQLRNSGSFAGGPGDAGVAARHVVLEAEKKNSKDNVTCMIIQFTPGDETVTESMEFTPGPVEKDSKFLISYEVMAQRAGTTLVKSIEQRYANICKELEDSSSSRSESEEQELKKELALFKTSDGGDDVPAEEGSAERTAWFEQWLVQAKSGPGEGDYERVMQASRFYQSLGQERQSDEQRAKVRLPDRATLEAAVDGHENLSWDTQMEKIANKIGSVEQDDKSDGTLQVMFRDLCIKAWVPKDCVTYIKEDDGETSKDSDKAVREAEFMGMVREGCRQRLMENGARGEAPAPGGGYDGGESRPAAPSQ